MLLMDTIHRKKRTDTTTATHPKNTQKYIHTHHQRPTAIETLPLPKLLLVEGQCYSKKQHLLKLRGRPSDCYQLGFRASIAGLYRALNSSKHQHT